jgi:hypothetical protein
VWSERDHQPTGLVGLVIVVVAATNGLSGEGGVSRSAAWQRAAEFSNPVYFAFEVSPTPYTRDLAP